MLDSYFTSGQLTFLIIGFLVLVFSVLVFQFTRKRSLAVVSLLIGIFLLRLFDVILDPFLNYWDEEFHALVAKNLSHNLLKPTLYPKDLLPYNFKQWTGNYIWVHKQPFFLWQMAVSIKLFGANIFALRLPSALCLTFSAFCIYRTGKNLINREIGFYAAFLFGTSFYLGELCTGSTSTDHNDLAFITYVTASVWAFSEHLIDPAKRKWIILIGVFAGIAILNKWLVGLLIYSGWGIHLLIDKQSGPVFSLKKYKPIAVAFITTLFVAAPWQIYCFLRFPQETSYEMAFNAKHLHEPVEGHAGDSYFYFDSLFYTYGKFSPLFILLGIVLLYSHTRNKKHYFSLFILFAVTYIFYTIVPTKMFGFTMIVSFFIYLGFGAIFYHLTSWIKNPLSGKIIITSLILVSGYLQLRIEEKQLGHTFWKKNIMVHHNRHNQIYWKNFCDNLHTLLPDKNYILFNCPSLQEHKLMFYTDYIGYWGLPNQEQIKALTNKGYRVAIYDDGNLSKDFFQNKSFLIVTDDSHKIVQSDTVKIIGEKFHPLTIAPDSRILCSYENPGADFVVNRYKDGTSSIRSLQNGFITFGVTMDELIFCSKPVVEHSERFYIEQVNNNQFKIKTVEGNYLKIIGGGNNVIATNDPNLTDDTFQFNKIVH